MVRLMFIQSSCRDAGVRRGRGSTAPAPCSRIPARSTGATWTSSGRMHGATLPVLRGGARGVRGALQVRCGAARSQGSCGPIRTIPPAGVCGAAVPLMAETCPACGARGLPRAPAAAERPEPGPAGRSTAWPAGPRAPPLIFPRSHSAPSTVEFRCPVADPRRGARRLRLPRGARCPQRAGFRRHRHVYHEPRLRQARPAGVSREGHQDPSRSRRGDDRRASERHVHADGCDVRQDDERHARAEDVHDDRHEGHERADEARKAPTRNTWRRSPGPGRPKPSPGTGASTT